MVNINNSHWFSCVLVKVCRQPVLADAPARQLFCVQATGYFSDGHAMELPLSRRDHPLTLHRTAMLILHPPLKNEHRLPMAGKNARSSSVWAPFVATRLNLASAVVVTHLELKIGPISANSEDVRSSLLEYFEELCTPHQ